MHVIATIPSTPAQSATPPGGAVPGRAFRLTQLVVWPSYGAMLMLPWIGTFDLAVMVPNKLVIAASGALVSTLLRTFYHAVLRRGASAGALAVLVCLVSLVAGAAWDASLALMLGSAIRLDTSRFGVLASGAPQLGGALYHALVLFAWSMAYLGLRQYRARGLRAETGPATAGRIVMRDGRHAVLFASEEIDWIEAAGDYVRVHAGARRLLLRTSMTAADAALPARDFVRIHRSAIVRLAQVAELVPLPNSEFEVVMRTGVRMRASRTYSRKLAARLTDAFSI